MATTLLRRSLTFLLATLVSASILAAQAKRPLRHTDYDTWRNIISQKLSPDGNFLVYGLFPQEGDGEVIVRNLKSSAEWREPAGARPEPPRPNQAALVEEEPPQPPSISIHFTPDHRFVVFSTFPTKAEVDKAKKEKKKPEEMPKGGVVIMDLASGTATRIAQVKSFRVPEKAGAVVAYLRAEKPSPGGTGGAKGNAKENEAGSAEPAAESPSKKPEKKKEYGSELVLRNAASGKEHAYADVLDYVLSKDGALLVYAVSSKQEENNGVFMVNAASDDAPSRALLQGRGKYTKLAFDEQQIQLAFLSDRDDAASKQPKLKLYLWQREAAAPVEVASASTPGLQEGIEISDKASISFSRDGKRIFFGCAKPPRPEKDSDKAVPEDEKVAVDLWHWKDDYIQPMQKVRAEVEKTRTFRAVFHIPENTLVQLADRTMPEIVPSEDGLWALGGDDREYRSMLEYDTRYADSYLVDTRTGKRTPVVKKHQGQVTWSPSGKYVLYFNDQHWITVSVPGAVTTVLNPKEQVKFWREDFDQPATPPPHGVASWTKDGKYVLIYDEFDVWRMTPDGSEAINLTQGVGRKNHLIFRHVNVNPDRTDPDAKWIDPGQPLLLRAEDKETRDTGFYRVRIDGKEPPQKLLMDAKSFSSPVKAKDADVLLLTASSFEQFPDLQVTDSSFKKLNQVSNANPQKSQFLWGTAELIHYRNADGVPLKGILYKPENFDPKKKYPLLVYIYEKLSQNLHNFVEPRPSHTIIPSYYVSNGYLVLEPDIVYTIGQPGQSALKCVLPAIDAVIAGGFVDEKAVGIQGHSWGGYQIAYMITQTNRFRAAAAGAPVANMTSAYDGIRWGPGIPRQFQYEHSQSRIGGNLWQVPLRYIENSPLFVADRVNTPLLMIHNDADDAVPWYQGIEYFLALRRLGKEVYMFSYNGEPHGLRRRANQKDYSVRLQQFFDHYLKGDATPEWMEKGIPYLERDEEKDRIKSQTGVY
ncbi:MAG TPA: prolyl oligopeptidase family serine peptidase [Candidatus Angelobacter sp.]|jgi:dipeptidyl aminopeptidase/acylaminoacyl peptidase|nr:prolyl oligopeptidase family serine peptidase [Candidatus Angelobacter sp.]